MKFILAKKLGMSQVFDKNGKVTVVTLVEAGPCPVVQIKTEDKDGYNAVQLGFGYRKAKNISKAQKGHLKKASQKEIRYLREFEVEETKDYKIGDSISVESFKEGDSITITGISKGKGFQGVIKRHGFKGSDATHGTKHTERAPGSIGSAFPERVWKGRKMAGRMGSDRKTIKGLKIVKVDKENNLLAILGAVPGNKGTLLLIKG